MRNDPKARWAPSTPRPGWRRGIQAVMPARAGQLDPPPCDPEAYPARNAGARGLGWLKRGRRVATRYDQHARRCLGFLYLAGTWDLAEAK